MGYVLVMYDVRGIQDYIFRTAKLKDAIGASFQVENIIAASLAQAVREQGISSERCALDWEDTENCRPIKLQNREWEKMDVQVLYIGGGNGFALISSRELARQINNKMAYIVVAKTYSLQLATAVVDMTGDYAEDYSRLQQEMTRVKATMIVSRPIGAPAVVEREIKTGYPLTRIANDGQQCIPMSTETWQKVVEGGKIRKSVQKAGRKLDSYVTEKGVDSMLAVVHIDGNNMGLRIRNLIQGVKDYTEAVNLMRTISYNINHDYKDVYEEMENHFNSESGARIQKGNNYFLMKVLVAGDDITYVCNAKIALSTVEYFCNKITCPVYTLNGSLERKGTDRRELNTEQINAWKAYGYSVCGGVAFIGSHFPFSIGYDVAEACCESAKKKAKLPENRDKGRGDSDDIVRIGNWLDFQICRNVQTRDLENTRKKEYITPSGERLLRRPYFIPTNTDVGNGGFAQLSDSAESFENFKRGWQYFTDSSNMPSSFSKELRNTYPLGKARTQELLSFLASRNKTMPDDYDGKADSRDASKALYYTAGDGKMTARWYDVLEMLDYYIDMNAEETSHE